MNRLIETIIRRFRNAKWARANRCEDRLHPRLQVLFSAAQAQSYLHYQYCRLHPCKVCGKTSCRWATERKTPRALTPEQQSNYDRMMRFLTDGDC